MNKRVKKALITTGAVIGTFILIAGGYVGYIFLSYKRIGNRVLSVQRKSELEEVSIGTVYKAMSYNIGFGAYSQDYTFFLDEGYDENGHKTCGYYSTAKSEKEVVFNTRGAIATALESEADFIFFQEVDTDSTRSYHLNQDKEIMRAYPMYDHVHAVNFHTAFLPYPLYDMHGEVHAGLTTISKYQIQSAYRHQYTIADDFSKIFDLDRCFSSHVINVQGGKKLYIVNSHMTAYSSNAELIRKKQSAELQTFLDAVKAEGNYAIVGGDWNHDLLTYNPDFAYTPELGHRPFDETKKTPDWMSNFFDETGVALIKDGYKVIASDNYPTCRNNDITWQPGKTFTCVVDGFIVSENIEIVSHENIQTKQGNKGLDGFAFADHDPATITFRLL